jgi:hypothetical protein
MITLNFKDLLSKSIEADVPVCSECKEAVQNAPEVKFNIREDVSRTE